MPRACALRALARLPDTKPPRSRPVPGLRRRTCYSLGAEPRLVDPPQLGPPVVRFGRRANVPMAVVSARLGHATPEFNAALPARNASGRPGRGGGTRGGSDWREGNAGLREVSFASGLNCRENIPDSLRELRKAAS